MTTVSHITAASRTTPCFRQFVRLPFLGEAWVEREAGRPQGVPFFDCAVDRDGGATGAVCADDRVTTFTVHAGNWVVVVDRAATSHRDHAGWRKAAWLTVGVPLVALVGIAACLLAGTARHALAGLRAR